MKTNLVQDIKVAGGIILSACLIKEEQALVPCFELSFAICFRMVKKIGAAIGQEGLVTTNRILNNVLEGQNFQDALKNEARVGVGNLLSKASDHLQKGHGKKRRGRPKAIKEDKKSKKLLLTSRVGPLPKRSRLRVDTLGYY